VQPCFDFSATPSPTRLFKGKVKLVWKGSEYQGGGEVLLQFLPTPRVVIDARVEAPFDFSMLWTFGEPDDLEFYLEGRRIEGFSGRRSAGDGILSLAWNPQIQPLEWGDSKAAVLAVVVSHLFNFPDFKRGGSPIAEVPEGCKQLVLRSCGWRIAIQSLPGKATTKEAWDRIREEGGCQLTHVAKVERDDGSIFLVEDAKQQIMMLTQFLSLVKGSSIWAVCDVGLDANGSRVWESWCAPRLGDPPYSWPDWFRGDQVEGLFPLFVTRWNQSEAWRDCLRHAIYWYTQANTGSGQPGIDSALILVQAALERLSHHRMVVDRVMISSDGFRKLNASDKLRMLLSGLGIPIEIPTSTPKIRDAARRRHWCDAPHAVTEIRNALVHPERKERTAGCYFEAWQLSLWYLELSILAMCGYEGSYRSRLNLGRVEDVPWKA
jgi:hypothetical protein